MNNLEVIKAGIFGVVVGDALGVPVEFSGRAERRADPVVGMREYGTHNQPEDWLDVIVKKDWINKLCEDFAYIMSY